MPILQQTKTAVSFGPSASPWNASFPHGLNDGQGNGITPDKVDVVSIMVEIAAAWYSVPTQSCIVTAADDVDVYVQLPPAGAWPVAPTDALVYVHAERVHSIVGLYSRNPDPGTAPPPMAGGVPGPPTPHAPTHLPTGPDPILFPYPSRELHVDPVNGSDSYPGTPNAPMRSGQFAIGIAETYMAPSMFNQVTIILHTANLAENLVIRLDGVNLMGVGGQGMTRVTPPTGPALVITNADGPSYAAFVAAGGWTNPMGFYGLLVPHGAPPPRCNQIKDLALGDPSGPPINDVMLLGVGPGNSCAGSEWNFMRCVVWHNFWASVCNYVSLQGECWIAGTIDTMNVAGLWCNRSQLSDVFMEYDSAWPMGEPSDPGNYGLNGANFLVNGVCVLNEEQRMGYDYLGNVNIRWFLDINDTGRAYIHSGYIGSDVDVEDAAGFTFEDVHIQGNLQLQFVAVGSPCTMDGGRYMGALADPGARLTRNVGA